MGTKIMLPLAVAAILVVAVGAVSLNWNIGLSQNGGYNRHVQVNQSTVFGVNYQNVSYNATNYGKVNRTTILKELGTEVQCRTNFIDSAAPIASNALGIKLNTSEVNTANAALQSDITSNASTITIRSDVLVFDGSALRLFGQVVGAGQKLNQTQLQSLRAQLNSSVQTLQNCTSTAGVKGSSSARFGFGFGSIHNFLIGFGGRMRTFWRGFSAGFHAKARAG